MDAGNEIREFLTSRRARITPEQAGLPVYGTRRRVTGMRREEVAMLAGISVEYYTRLERGTALPGISDEVVDGVARALQLDEAERAHLFDLIRGSDLRRVSRRRPAQEKVRPVIQRVLDGMTGIPAYLRNGRLNILAANRLGRSLYSPAFAGDGATPNMARFLFLEPAATDFFADWEAVASDAVAILRSQAGQDPYDRRLTDLVGELSTRSHEFRVRWAAHNVKFHRTGAKRLRHPVVGELTLDYEALELPGDRGQRIVVYTADPGSPSHQALDLLGRWFTAPDTAAHRASAAPEG